jgi:hypothetical protein
MITSAQCRLYAKKSQLLGKTLDVSFKRRDQAMIMALRWSRLADQIDRDDATTAPESPALNLFEVQQANAIHACQNGRT